MQEVPQAGLKPEVAASKSCLYLAKLPSDRICTHTELVARGLAGKPPDPVCIETDGSGLESSQQNKLGTQ